MSTHILKTLLFLLIVLTHQSTSQAASLPGGLPIPSLDDERSTYRSWGWTWTTSKEPNFQGDSAYTVSNPDVHGDTESDDLWNYIMMYRRTGQQGYLDRARAWARYFKDDYRQCIPAGGDNYCSDRDSYLADHFYGWGLIEYYYFTGDSAYLTAAQNIGKDIESKWSGASTGGRFNEYGNGLRAISRHLILASRLAETVGTAQWITLRDKLTNIILQTPDWDNANGMTWIGRSGTDGGLGAGSYDAGWRVQAPFQIGILTEALYQVYRTTSRKDVADRLVAMANYVDLHGLDPVTQYTGANMGRNMNTGAYIWSGGSGGIYTTSFVNLLVVAYKITGNAHYYDRAKYFFNRGVKSVYGNDSARCSADTVVCAFIDTRFDSSSGNFYLDRNKGELQYTYLIFESALGGDTTPPLSPRNLTVK